MGNSETGRGFLLENKQWRQEGTNQMAVSVEFLISQIKGCSESEEWEMARTLIKISDRKIN